MSRRARVVVPGCAHHVTQRGNRQANVFRSDADRLYYMAILREQLEAANVLLWSYTLMTNHIHTIVVPQDEKGLSDTFRNAHSTYGKWFNKKYDLTGHLWQGRFYSCVLSENHLWTAVRYVERNPVRARMVKRAEAYRWSSAQYHVYGRPDPLMAPGLPLIREVGSWKDWLAAEDDESQLKAIRKSTAKDIPFGDDEFIDQLEIQLGRPLRPRKPGRKPKPKEEKQASPLGLAFGCC
jgi:putative transposase